MNYIKRCYTSPFTNTTPAIYADIEALPLVEIEPDVFISQWDGIAVLNVANLSSSNNAVVEVSALLDTHTELALTYTDVGLRHDTDEDGNPTQEQIKLEQAIQTNRSNERKQLRDLNKKLDRVDKLIAKTDKDILVGQAVLIEIDEVLFDLDSLDKDIDKLSKDNYKDDIQILYDKLEELYPSESDKWVELLKGEEDKTDLFNEIFTRIDSDIASYNRKKIKVDKETKDKQKQKDGVVDTGRNLVEIKSDLETKITVLIS